MSKAAKINKAIEWLIYGAFGYFASIAVAGYIKRKREQKSVGKVERIKRRIYKEVSMAQKAGVDFSKKYDQLTSEEKEALKRVGQEVGWKQSKRSIESGKPYVESYFGSLRRAWNSVSGVMGIGRAYDVKDAQGNVVLTWIEDAAAHVEAEREIEEKRQRALEAEERAAKARKRLAKARRASIVPSVPVVRKSKQQEIVEAFPYLKVMDNPNDPIPAADVPFGFVLWKIVKNSQGEKSYEGAAMAFTNRTAAESAKAYMKREEKNIIHPAWQDFTEKAKKQYDEHYKSYGSWYRSKDDNTQYLVKDVSKVKLDNISGIGYAKAAENELYEIWREQLEYGDTDYDYDTWRAIYGDEYAQAYVLPYV